MAGDPGERYTVAELAALYEYEPTLRDVYVEGRTDVGLLTWYFKGHGLTAIAFAVDDRVEVPGDLCRGLGQDTNARGRAIALAIALEEGLGASQTAATVVVDADFNWLTGPYPVRRSCLLMTDWPAMEQYASAERPLTKFLRVGAHVPDHVTASSVIEAIGPALTDLFVARAVLFHYGIRCIADVARVCTLQVGRSSADVKELIVRSLSGTRSSERPASIDQMVDHAYVLRGWIASGTWVGRGHDIAPLLIDYLGLSGPSANPESVETAMRISLELADIDEAPLFVALRRRTRS